MSPEPPLPLRTPHPAAPLQGASLQVCPPSARGPRWVHSQARQAVHRSLQAAPWVQARNSLTLVWRLGKGQTMLRRSARGVSITFTLGSEASGCLELAWLGCRGTVVCTWTSTRWGMNGTLCTREHYANIGSVPCKHAWPIFSFDAWGIVNWYRLDDQLHRSTQAHYALMDGSSCLYGQLTVQRARRHCALQSYFAIVHEDAQVSCQATSRQRQAVAIDSNGLAQ